MKRFEYVCTTCGRAFGRRFPAKRHLNNINIHNGQGAITSVMDYMLGVVKGSYPWPSLPRNGNLAKDGESSKIYHFYDYLDKIHKTAEFVRDFREMQGQLSPSKEATSLPSIELLLGYICKKCCVGGGFALTNFNENQPLNQIHQCNPKQMTSLLKTGMREHFLQKYADGFPGSFRSVVERWVKGEKYLYALPLSTDYLPAISPKIQKINVKLSQLRKYADDNQRNHYLHRAIEEAGKNSWTSIDDSELLDLVRNTHATGAVFTIISEGGSPTGTYLIAIVPPHKIAEKKRNDELIGMMNHLGLGLV